MQKHTVWKNNLKFSGMNRVKSPHFEAQYHILKKIIINNILFLPFSRTPEQCPSVVSLLSESYNPHVRYGAAMALGICCAGTGNKVRARSICGQDCSCSLLPQTHLCANITHADGFLTHIHCWPAGVQHYFKFFNCSGHRVSFPACTE